MIMLLEILTRKACYISMVIYELMTTLQVSYIAIDANYLVQSIPLMNILMKNGSL